MMRRYLPKSTEEAIRWYERYVSPLSLIAGFLADTFIFVQRVDLLRGHLLLSFYLVVAALGIAFQNAIAGGRLSGVFWQKTAPFVPVVVQFAFGGLFSAYLSLYSRSAAFAASWIFVILLAALLIGNERFRRYYVHLPFQMALYFTVLFSFFIFLLPIIASRLGTDLFVLAGVASIGIVALFLAFLFRLTPEIVRRERASAIRAIAAVFFAFNIFYFGDVLPPLPLALKDAGVYHAISRADDGTYIAQAEPRPWYALYQRYSTQFHRAPDEGAIVFSAVFAPSGLSFTLVHEWEHFDAVRGEWLTDGRISFPVVGGREEGYRVYSMKSALRAGEWRVNVLTEHGQLIGRISFDVIDAPAPAPTQEERH